MRSLAAYSVVCYLLQIKDRHNGEVPLSCWPCCLELTCHWHGPAAATMCSGNILLDTEGHIIHIDFGFVLGTSPGNMNFERAPFKLTSEFVAVRNDNCSLTCGSLFHGVWPAIPFPVQVMGGANSRLFHKFRTLCVRAFLEARKHRARIVNIVEMMLPGNEHLPCFAGNGRAVIEALNARFFPNDTPRKVLQKVHKLIDESLGSWRTTCYDKYQRCCVGIL